MRLVVRQQKGNIRLNFGVDISFPLQPSCTYTLAVQTDTVPDIKSSIPSSKSIQVIISKLVLIGDA